MNNEKVMVSIIIPAWNVEKYIFRALDSCLKQTYKNLEIIVVDDGSTDDTVKIIKEYQKKDSRVHLLEQVHGGVSAARNMGINEASGQKIVFLDSDDWMVQDAIELLVEKSYQYPRLLIGAKPLFIQEGKEDEGKSVSEKEFDTVVLSKYEALMNTDTEKYRNASVQYKLFDKEIICNNNIRFDNEILFGEDGLFVFYYLNHTDGMVYLDVYLWNYLVRGMSSTRTAYKEAFMTSIYGVEKMISYPRETSESIDTMLKAFLVTKALNMFRRYLDSGNTDLEIPRKYKEYIQKYKSAYFKSSTSAQKIRTYVILYMPLSLYMMVYRMAHRI